MGCLNPDKESTTRKWFANIHLSGPCNRACYFCIGQHMMNLDPLNTLDTPPAQMKGIVDFIEECQKRGVTEVNITGSNTDPLLYRHTDVLVHDLKDKYAGFTTVGVRTNGVLSRREDIWGLYDKISISLASTDEAVYAKMMGFGSPPDVQRFVDSGKPVKVNIVLGSQNLKNRDILSTIIDLSDMGVRQINLREPYGQPRVYAQAVKAMTNSGWERIDHVHGMMRWLVPGVGGVNTEVTLWDVHYVEVESVNLYANGRVSLDYSVTKGCSEDGKTLDQRHFKTEGRVREQWQ